MNVQRILLKIKHERIRLAAVNQSIDGGIFITRKFYFDSIIEEMKISSQFIQLLILIIMIIVDRTPPRRAPVPLFVSADTKSIPFINFV